MTDKTDQKAVDQKSNRNELTQSGTGETVVVTKEDGTTVSTNNAVKHGETLGPRR